MLVREDKAPVKAALLVNCPAESGLVTRVLVFVQSHGGAISQVDHHLDYGSSNRTSSLSPNVIRSLTSSRRVEIWSESFWPGRSDSTWRTVSPCAEAGRRSLAKGWLRGTG